MQSTDINWSQTEQEIAQLAFNKAYERELASLIQTVREQASEIAEPQDMWKLHDFLSAKRHEVDGKYDNRYPSLVFVFAQLVKEGWLNLSELEGLDTAKLAKVAALSRM